MSAIRGYGCSSAAGRGAERLWAALAKGEAPAARIGFKTGGDAADAALAGLRIASWPARGERPGREGAREEILAELLESHREALGQLASSEERERFSGRAGARLGVILASTKGLLDDFIWDPGLGEAALDLDPLTPLLEAFVERAGLRPARSICVSNACASGLSALFLAESWLRGGRVTHVTILAADRAGPFVASGFHALKALCAEAPRPFSARRDGLRLGDGAAAILLAREAEAPGLRLDGVGLDAEGHAVTRAAETGESLLRACRQIPGLSDRPPGLVIAHGTGTPINDAVEDQVLWTLFGGQVPVTGTKWCLGHTLGASSVMDVVAACEALRRGAAFRVASTSRDELDPALRSRVLSGPGGAEPIPGLREVLVTSLGFGGIHAAARISRTGGSP